MKIVKTRTEDIATTQMKTINQYMLYDIPNERIAELILLEGDVKKHSTNLKCDMTDYNFYTKHEELKNVTNIISNTINQEDQFNYIMSECWGAVYRKSHTAIPHDHYPYVKSFIYYVQSPEGSSPLIFDESHQWNMEKEKTPTYSIKPKTGLLVVFPSECKHSVPPSDIDDERIALAGNLFYVPNEALKNEL